MKKLFILFLAIAFVACGQTDVEKKADQPVNADSVKAKSDDKNLETKDYEKLGAKLMEEETVGNLKIGLKASDLTSILGKPSEKTKNELWGADGEYHQTYKYSKLGVELDMIGKNESDKVINMITIVSPCNYKTSKGISIGSNYQDVEKAYKDYLNTEFSNKESIVAGSNYGGVIFSFKNEKVASIFVGASAE